MNGPLPLDIKVSIDAEGNLFNRNDGGGTLCPHRPLIADCNCRQDDWLSKAFIHWLTETKDNLPIESFFRLLEDAGAHRIDTSYKYSWWAGRAPKRFEEEHEARRRARLEREKALGEAGGRGDPDAADTPPAADAQGADLNKEATPMPQETT